MFPNTLWKLMIMTLIVKNKFDKMYFINILLRNIIFIKSTFALYLLANHLNKTENENFRWKDKTSIILKRRIAGRQSPFVSRTWNPISKRQNYQSRVVNKSKRAVGPGARWFNQINGVSVRVLLCARGGRERMRAMIFADRRERVCEIKWYA